MAIHSFLFSFRKNRKGEEKLKTEILNERKKSQLCNMFSTSLLHLLLSMQFILFISISILNQMSNLLTEHFLLILQFRNIKHSQWPEEIKILSILQIRDLHYVLN